MNDVYRRKTVTLRYYLYPLKIGEAWDYYLDWGSTLSAIPEGAKVMALSHGARLIARPGLSFASLPEAGREPAGKLLMIFLAVCVFQIILGQFILGLFHVQGVPGFGGAFGSTAYLIGFFLSGMSVWFYLMGGGTLTPVALILLWGALALVFFVAARFFRKGKREIQGQAGEFIQQKAASLSRAFFTINFLWILFLVFLAMIFPICIWDEMANWVLKAKMIFVHQEIVPFHPFSNYYPLLWPVQIASLFCLNGGMADVLVKLISGAALLAFWAQLRSGLRLLKVRQPYVEIIPAGYFFLFFTPYLISGLAESIFLAYCAGFLLAMMMYLKHPFRFSYFFLVLVFGCGLSAIKFEGAATVFICVLAFLFLPEMGWGRKKWLTVVCLCLGTAVIPALWHSWIRIHHWPVDIYHLKGDFSAAPIRAIIGVWRDLLLRQGCSALIVIPLGFAYLFRNTRPWDVAEKYLLLSGLGLTLFSVVAVVHWPAEHIKGFYPELAMRLFLHATPAFVLLWGSRMFNRSA